jgi:DNA-binding CsgD family transcriptional regulator
MLTNNSMTTVNFKGQLEPLTKAETEILELLANGMSNEEISDYRHNSPNTINQHLGVIYSKFGLDLVTKTSSKRVKLTLLFHGITPTEYEFPSE